MADFDLLHERKLKQLNQTACVCVWAYCELCAEAAGITRRMTEGASSASEMTLCAESMAPKHI